MTTNHGENLMTFTAQAYYNYREGTGSPEGFKAELIVDNRDIAEIERARFPKSLLVKVNTITLEDGSKHGLVVFHVSLGQTKGNAANETGVKRIRRFLQLVGTVEWKTVALNSYTSLDNFLVAL